MVVMIMMSIIIIIVIRGPSSQTAGSFWLFLLLFLCTKKPQQKPKYIGLYRHIFIIISHISHIVTCSKCSKFPTMLKKVKLVYLLQGNHLIRMKFGKSRPSWTNRLHIFHLLLRSQDSQPICRAWVIAVLLPLCSYKSHLIHLVGIIKTNSVNNLSIEVL